ncbi:YdcH family protein [Acinetobacter wanghuae]|uniref:YdcH family protein n=1 Tax=Acinetobacter wanghuae TaxID=2662362 RepID=UPI003AF51573
MKTKDCNKKIKHMFPEYRDLIVQLREENPYFANLFEEHAVLDKQIAQLELDPINHINDDIEGIKRKKLKLKDEIYRLLKSSEADPLS